MLENKISKTKTNENLSGRKMKTSTRKKLFERRKLVILGSYFLCLVFGLVLFGCSSKKDDNHSVSQGNAVEITDGFETGSSKATQTAEYLGTVKRNVPTENDISDMSDIYGTVAYPTWGQGSKNINVAAGEHLAVINESRALTPYPTWHSANLFDAIDAEGYLLRNGNRVQYTEGSKAGEYMKLYKHVAATGMYGGDVSDDEPAVIKKISYLSRTGLSANQITGLYAPAGEIVKIEMSEEDLAKTGGLHVYIGQNYNIDGNDHVSMEWGETSIKGNGLVRMSDCLSHYVINSTTSYVGSFLGGPIYIRPTKNTVAQNFSVTISGAVKYQHFILGVTTPEEYELNKASSAPYFDLEIYDSAVRFTTTKHTSSGGLYLRDYTYENCTDAAVLWDKITQVSTRVQNNGLSSALAPVQIIGDCYIAAGAAYANPGRNGVVCPPSWLAEALNYNTFVNSGCWGTMHEYNHCWQGYGVGNGGEVTNNAVTLVSYSLYTRISASRTIGGGVSGWNRFTDPGKSLGELLTLGSNGSARTDLSLYATLLHNIGQDNFIEAARGGRESGSTVYYNNLVNATHYDMTYYFTDVLNFGISDVVGGTGNPSAVGNILTSAVEETQSHNYPVFVPVSSTYQVGRSIIYDGETQYIRTAQPFRFTGSSVTMDFSNQNNFASGNYATTELVIPDGFTVKVKSVTQPENGTVKILENNKVEYTCHDGDMLSGEFLVTLQITKDDGAFDVEDVDLIINLQQTNVLQRTTYTYDAADMINDPTSVYNSETGKFDFGNYNWTETIDNVCPQESTCQIWAGGINSYDKTFNLQSETNRNLPLGQTIQTLDGIIYLSGSEKYRIALKGRGKIALFLSFDKGQTWELAVNIERPANGGTAFVEGNWKDYTLSKAENCIYFKAVMIVCNNASDFFGIGFATEQTDDEGAGLGTFGSIANANGYRSEEYYEALHEKFTTEYHFTRKYTYSYSDTSYATEHTVVSSNRTSWDNDATNNYVIGNMFDGNTATNFLSYQSSTAYITEANPFELVVDMGRTIYANSVTFYGYNTKSNSVGNLGMPHSFKLYTSLDGVNFTLLLEKVDEVNTTKNVTFTFDTCQMRYYKLVVTKTDNGKYFGMNYIEFSLSYPNGIHVAPNAESVTYTGDAWSSENVLCNFGRIYIGGKGDYVEFKFTGTRFAYLAYQAKSYGTVDIYIDGKLVAENVSLNEAEEAMSAVYVSDLLSNKEHTIKIVGNSGKFNVDSFAYWEN